MIVPLYGLFMSSFRVTPPSLHFPFPAIAQFQRLVHRRQTTTELTEYVPQSKLFAYQVEASAIWTVERSARTFQKIYEERQVADVEAGGEGGKNQ